MCGIVNHGFRLASHSANPLSNYVALESVAMATKQTARQQFNRKRI